MEKKVVIIGASYAGTECAFHLRQMGFKGAIDIFTEEAHLAYHRPPLSRKYLSEGISESQLMLRPESLYQQKHIQVHTRCRVNKIHRAAKHIQLADGRIEEYDDLVLAVGAFANKLPVQSAQAAKVHYLRNILDAQKIKNILGEKTRVLIVGGGYIGLEVAASARALGAQVTLLQSSQRILKRVTAPIVSDYFTQLHRQNGVNLRCNTRLMNLDLHTDDSLLAHFSDGGSLKCDCVIAGVGVTPNIKLAQEAGLHCENGIVVNAFMQTEDENIYAIGDCANYPDAFYQRRVRLESVPNAKGQAKVAASAICHQHKTYQEIPWFWSDQYHVKLQTVGLFQGYDTIVSRGDFSANKMSVFYLKNAHIIAMDAMNAPADFLFAKKAISNNKKIEAAQLADNTIPLKSIFL